jgi:hypothetical protein
VPHCPMMANKPVAAIAITQGAAQIPTCCQVSPAGPTPESESVAPPDGSRVALANVQTAVLLVSVPAIVHACDEAPPPLLLCSQAVLCTFLI